MIALIKHPFDPLGTKKMFIRQHIHYQLDKKE
jgi:hypothetical protein